MAQREAGWFTDPTDPQRLRWWNGTAWSDHVWQGEEGSTAPLPTATAESTPKRSIPAWIWIVIALVAAVPLLLLSPLTAAIALIVLVTGIVALVTRRSTWLRLRSRSTAMWVTAGAAVTLLLTGSISVAALQGGEETVAANVETTTPSPVVTRTPTPTPTPVIEVTQETETEVIEFVRSEVEDGAITRGETQVRTEGKNGERTLTYDVTWEDGKEVDRVLVSEEITVAPVDEVVAIGTYDPPAPEPVEQAPAESNCDSNYADACVPVASDVDCAGGSGNGPAYFDGIARVVGTDVYDLDRDNDGYACE